ncbi:hypothetical protein NHX12_006824 [Muraenolepis orangiensis]|uniref:G-protein coupled receptors family 1 profile domain-containing protein n=1 Tax=Muraenolepis orangiensis TaxID=630683 RepID=A0A9Q0DS92_9TELE|nr:hypothetical protein NHX12_006824 [Muraenolepis orangiensis]
MENTLSPNQTSPPSSLSLCPTFATLYVLPCLYTLLFLTGLPGNVLSLWVFLWRISDTAPTQVYLSHLSVSNLLVSLTTPFMAVYYAQASAQPATSALCQLVLHGATPVLHINIHLSVGLLTWVALSRLAVLINRTPSSGANVVQRCCPAFFGRLRRVSFARRICVGAWVLVVGSTSFVTLYYSVKEAGSGLGQAAGRGGAANRSHVPDEGRKEEDVALCYSPDTELGGTLSTVGQVTTITMFFACFLLVLLCYMLLSFHLMRSRHNVKVAASRGLLRRVLRNIILIKMVLTFCLVPYNVYKAVFISLGRDYHQGDNYHSSSPKTHHCHPLSSLIEVKNFLLLLAILRGSLDPVMYFLLDRTFQKQTLILLRLKPQTSTPALEAAAQLPGQSQLGPSTRTGDISHTSAI